MTVLDLILTFLAVFLAATLFVRYKKSGETNYIMYIFDRRGIITYLLKMFSMVLILLVIIFWIQFLFGKINIEIDWSFLNYKVF